MGFGSGVDIFDEIASAIIEADDLSNDHKAGILAIVIEALENHDWDTQDDARGYHEPGPVREAFKKVHPDWFGPVPAPEDPKIGDKAESQYGEHWIFTEDGWKAEWD